MELEEHSCDLAEDMMTVDRRDGSMNLSWMHTMNIDLRLTFSNSWHPLALEPKRIMVKQKYLNRKLILCKKNNIARITVLQ